MATKPSYMLAIDLKKTTQVNLEQPLRKYIEEQGFPVDQYSNAINQVNTLRESIRNAQDKTESVLNMYEGYYGMMDSLEKRVPINEQEVRIQFCWYDIFRGKKASKYSVMFEKVNLMFNMGCILSHIGVSMNRTTDDGIKNAAKNFQMAAGAFTQVKQELERNPAIAELYDLHPDSLNLLTSLMLAQAQECFYEKAVKSQMQPVVLTKLAAQVVTYYESCITLSTGAHLKGYLNKKWPSYFETKLNIYKALAHYQLGVERGMAEAYGEQVARLQAAYRILEEEKKKKILTELQDFFNATHAMVTKAFSSAQKDNNTVYHEIVPSESKLAPLQGKSMVKSIELELSRLSLKQSGDPFEELVPFSVRKYESIYSERKAELIREMMKTIEEHGNVAKGLLSSLGLPGALEALESPTGIPPALLHKMATVRQEGGVKMLMEQIELLDKVAMQDEILLKEATEILDAEEKEDAEMRKQFGNRWNRTPSHTLTANLRQEAQKYFGNVEHARKSDEFVKQKLKLNADGINKLTWPQEKILSELPADNSQAPQLQVASKLRQLLNEIQSLLQRRETLIQQMRDRSAKDDLTQKLLQTPESEIDALFTQELSKYDDIVEAIKNTFSEQIQLLKQIQEENENFVQARRMNTQLEQRQAALQAFENSFKAYIELKTHLKEGIQFYTKFQDILTVFKGKCSDFALARKTEKQDLLADLQASATGMSVGSAPFAGAFTTTGNNNASQPSPPPYGAHVQSQGQPLTAISAFVAAPGHSMPQQVPTTAFVQPQFVYQQPGVQYIQPQQPQRSQQPPPVYYYPANPPPGY